MCESFILFQRRKIFQPDRSATHCWCRSHRSERSPRDPLHIPLRLISPASPLHTCFFFFAPSSFTVTLWSAGRRGLYLQPPDVLNNSSAGVKVVPLAATKREKNAKTPQRVRLNLSPIAPPRRGLSAHVLCGRTYLFFTMVKRLKKNK